MSSSLITGKYVVCKANSRFEAEIIEDGAIYQEEGKIVAIGKRDELAAKYQADEVIGSPDHVVMPGFVNAHHHVGLTPVQLGSRDYALELWLAKRLSARNVPSYLDTMYSAFEMIESGITTVQHLQGWRGPVDQISDRHDQIISAYNDIGMRVSFSFLIRDQNHIVHQDDDVFCQSLPPNLGSELARYLQAGSLTLKHQIDLFEDSRERYNGRDRTRIQLAPANLHWCSDQALAALGDLSERYRVPMHMHLLETAYQKEYARKRSGATAIQHLHRFGLLGPRMTLGHGVWLSEGDIDLCAETGTNICHNASSNLRLKNGIAPVTAMAARGVNVAMGTDSTALNDDDDMVQEMRLVNHLHRLPGIKEPAVNPHQVLKMATINAARPTFFHDRIGALEKGRRADLVILDHASLEGPYLDPNLNVVDILINRGKTRDIKTVLIDGRVVLKDGEFPGLSKADVIQELKDRFSHPLDQTTLERRGMVNRLAPYVESFYESWNQPEASPHYHYNSRT